MVKAYQRAQRLDLPGLAGSMDEYPTVNAICPAIGTAHHALVLDGRQMVEVYWLSSTVVGPPVSGYDLGTGSSRVASKAGHSGLKRDRRWAHA